MTAPLYTYTGVPTSRAMRVSDTPSQCSAPSAARVNPAVHPEELAALDAERDAVLAALPGARPRVDSLRLVVSPDFLSLRR